MAAETIKPAQQPTTARVVAFVVDASFCAPTLVAIHSLLSRWNQECGLKLVLVAKEFPPKWETAFRRLVDHYAHFATLTRHGPPDEMLRLPSVGHLSPATFGRVFVPTLLEDVAELLYLDADILVQQDLSDWPQPGPHELCRAAIDLPRCTLGSPRGVPYCTGEYADATDLELRNPGILPLNARLWREQEIARRVVEFSFKYRDKLRYADQDAINAVCGHLIGDLDASWNVKASVADRAVDPRVLHFTGTQKPWNSGVVNSHVVQYCMEAKLAFHLAGVSYTGWSTRRLITALRTAALSRMRS